MLSCVHRRVMHVLHPQSSMQHTPAPPKQAASAAAPAAPRSALRFSSSSGQAGALVPAAPSPTAALPTINSRILQQQMAHVHAMQQAMLLAHLLQGPACAATCSPYSCCSAGASSCACQQPHHAHQGAAVGGAAAAAHGERAAAGAGGWCTAACGCGAADDARVPQPLYADMAQVARPEQGADTFAAWQAATQQQLQQRLSQVGQQRQQPQQWLLASTS